MFIQHGFQHLGHMQNETQFFFRKWKLFIVLTFLQKKEVWASFGNHRRLNGKMPFLISSWLIIALIRSKCCLDTSQGYYIILSSAITTITNHVGNKK